MWYFLVRNISTNFQDIICGDSVEDAFEELMAFNPEEWKILVSCYMIIE